jgi:hypothetical protein
VCFLAMWCADRLALFWRCGVFFGDVACLVACFVLVVWCVFGGISERKRKEKKKSFFGGFGGKKNFFSFRYNAFRGVFLLLRRVKHCLGFFGGF